MAGLDFLSAAKKRNTQNKSNGAGLDFLSAAKQGADFYWDAEAEKEFKERTMSELRIGDKTLGRISTKGYKAIQDGTVDAYTPINDDEAATIAAFKSYAEQEAIKNSPYAKFQAAKEIGQYGKGNVDLYARPKYKNEDGSISTVESISINEDGKEVLIPTVITRGERNPYAVKLSEEEAIQHYKRTGEHLGKFDSVEEANEYAQKLHNAQDFYYGSKYTTTAKSNVNDVKPSALTGLYADNGFEDITYDYINRNKTALDRQELIDVSTNASFAGVGKSFLKTMTDDEVALFNYLYKNTGKDTAYQFLSDLEGDLNLRSRLDMQEYWAEYAKQQPIRSSIFSVATSPLKGLSYVGQVADYADDGEIDQNAGYNKFSYANSAIRNQNTENIESPVGKFLYQTGMSLGDFAANTVAAGGMQPVSLALMGAGAAADTTIAARDRGVSSGKALALGTISGIAEAAMEKIAFDRLFSLNRAGEGAAKYILGNMLTEGTEELATDAINLTADILISKDKSEWHQKIQDYMAEGKSKEDAIFQAIVDQGISMGASFLGGAISGGVLSGATTARINALGRSNRQNVDSIINEGLSADVNSVAYKSAAQLQKTHEGYEAGAFKKDVPNFDVGYQMILNESYAAEEAQKTAKAGDAVTPQTLVDSTAAPVADTAAVTPVSDAAATTQSPAAETTAPATVSVGDTFHDTKYGNTITVVARDDASTTVEINTGKGTERKVLTNDQASVLVTRGQYEQTGSAVSDVYTAITRGNITAKQADAIVANPAMRSAFERLTGEKLTGTKAEQRATVRNWATNEANIENLRLKKAGLTQAHAKVASLLENPVSANIRMIAKSATLAQAFTDLTGVTLEGDMDTMRSAIKANTALAMESYADAIESSGWDAFNTSSTPPKSTSVEKTDADAGVDASDVFKTDTDGKIRFKQMDIDYTNTKMRKGTFRIRGERATDVNTVDGHIRGKYGICKLDGEKAYVVSLLQSGLEIGKFKTLTEAKKVATYADDNFAFNDVGYAVTATGKYVSVMTDAFRGYLNDVQQMLAEKPYDVKAKTEETATETKETVETKTVDTQENTDEPTDSRETVEVEGKGAVAWNSLTERQQQAITFMEGFAKAANMKLVFTAHGKVNGAYDIHGDTMYLDIYASENPLDNTEGLIIPTASHELTHWMRFQVPALWNKLSNAVFSALEEIDGISRTDRINAEIERLRNSKLVKSANTDVAEQEIVSRACEDMLARSEQGKKIFESLSKSEQKTLTAKIKNVIAKIKDWISGMLSSYESGSREAATLRKCEAKLEEISKLWDEALAKSVEVSKSKPNDPRATTRNEALAKYGIQFDMGTKSVAPTSLFSERTWTESEYVQNRETAINAVMKATGVDRADAERYINNINSIARLIADDRARLDYEPNMDDFASVLKSNSEYKWTVDMSTLCAKRLLTTGTFDAIQKALPDTVFDSDDIVKLRSMMLERGYEVACGICYVESTRRELGPITAEFIKRYKMSQETGKPITRVNSEGKVVELTKTKEQKETTADKSTDKFFADKNYTPTLADLNTTDIDRVKVEHPLVYEAYLNFMNARGQAKPKLLETRAEYKGEILKHFKYKNTVNARNRAGGLRVQSFSDFEIAHLIDMMQIALDMSRVGLMSQAYTKVPAFAEVFGDTGIKINLSLIAKDSGLDENGNLIFDDVEGIPHEDAFRLRDEYSKNVGTVLVGKNDAHIIAAMADPRIDYIIPFHKSSWKESLYDALGLTGYEDYTDTQNEKPFDKSREINNFQPSEYWDYSKTGEENAKIYLEKCEKDGRRPKFPQFIGYDGYWKLLIDFKMYDNDGVGSPQTVVMPEFNMDAANRIMNEYKGGHRSLPVAQDVVKDFVEEYKSKADADIDTGDTAMYNGEEAGSDGILYSQREGYWVPDLTRTQMASLRRAIKDDIGPSVNQITDTANWLFTSISGTKVLAIYSTENPNNPTLLYESKGKQATLERQLIEWILEDYNYGTSDDGKSKTFDAILSGSWLRQGSRVQNSSGPLGRGGGARNARVLQGKPSGNPSRAFRSVIENLFKVSGDGVVYSERDTQKVTEQENAEYMDAYYDGDDDKCQELVDRVANRLGYTYKAYHHTENAFNVFDLNKARKSMDIQGFFFSADPDAESEYGSVRYDSYLKMTNPYIVDSKEAQKAIPFDMSKSDAGVTAREWLQSQGYDGVIRKAEYFGAEADEYIVFDSAQVKSAEPYTYADDANGEGEIIPLSERFNDSNEDIRYSERDTDVDLDALTLDEIEALSDEKLDALYKALGLDSILTNYDLESFFESDESFDTDAVFEDISEELNTEPKKIEILIRRNGLGTTHIAENRTAVMTNERIDRDIDDSGARFQPDYARRYITRIAPKDFIDLTVANRHLDRDAFDSQVEGDSGSTMQDVNYADALRDSKQTPYLSIDRSTGRIIGHNGRHRIRALEMAGIESVEIEVEFHDEDGALIKYGAETIPDMAISSQFDTAIETRLANIIPLNEAHRGEIEKRYGEKAHDAAGVRYSERDSEGRALSEEQQEYFRESKVRDADGNLLVCHHGTDENFSVFDASFISRDNKLGYGFYFMAGQKLMFKYKNPVEAYLNIRNPITDTSKNLSAEKVADFCDTVGVDFEYDADERDLGAYERLCSSYTGEIRTFLKHAIDILGVDGILSRERNVAVAFSPDQVKLTSNPNPTENDDIRYSLRDNGVPDIFDAWDEAVETYGAIPQGENPVRDVKVPQKIDDKRVVSRFARTMMEAEVTPEENISDFEKAIMNGEMTHEVITNQKAGDWARRRIEHLGFEEALKQWELFSESGNVGKNELALGMELYNQCITNKDVPRAMKLAAELAAEATRAGQTLQACRMLKLMTPDGQLYYLEKSIQKMNEEFRDKLGDKFKDIELDDQLVNDFLQESDEKKRNELYDKICQSIADQIPATPLDKWNAWRYLAMLGNLRTHLRNIVGNVIFIPSLRIKNFVGAVLEKTMRVKPEERTRSFRKTKEAVEFAKNDFLEMQKTLQGENAKYAVTSDIEGKRTIFKTPWLEKVRQKNFDFLEAEDMWFLKMHYVDALARLITVRGIDINSITPDKLNTLRRFAVNEAQSATYRDANSLAEALNKLHKKLERSDNKFAKYLGATALEGVMPFKKTPLNIAKQGINYSPLGLLKGVYKVFKNWNNPVAHPADAIDDFAKGLTGTGVMLLGYWLASLGFLEGEDDETKKAKAFDKMLGDQPYSLKSKDGDSYTIDWATPSNLALFVGAKLYELSKDEFTLGDLVDALSTVSEPLLELSVFSGINGTIESAQYSETQPLVAIASDMAISYLTQALPTLGGQISRIFDKNKREYYFVDKNSNWPQGLQRIAGQAASKIPFASYLFEPSIDVWGREETYGGVVERVFENTASPGYYAEENYTEVDKVLKELYNRTGDAAALPTEQQKYFTEGDARYNMTAQEYTEAQKIRGQKSFELVSDLLADKKSIELQDKKTKQYKTKKFSQMTDEEKVTALEKCYKEAGNHTKEQMLEKVKSRKK